MSAAEKIVCKAEIDRLVNIWLDVVLSVSNDAGWEGDSLLSKVIEFGGTPPTPTGNDQSNVTLLLAMRLLKDPNPEYYRINPVMRVMLRLKPELAHALLAKHFYRGACPKTSDGDDPAKLKAWTDSDRAMAIQQDPKRFALNLYRAYQWASDRLFVVDAFVTQSS